ncbi:MAG TPA: lamin tail domain-containing protein [Puia sp.]|nr:lamin tail domain-containing protein [Puia sp.]
MKSIICIVAALQLTSNLHAQFTDNFNDGDFTANPVWTGNAADWIVNSSSQLQSNNTVANSNFYITTPNTLAVSAQWELYTQLAFNTSSANYADIFLTATASDLTSNNTTGYFVRIGNTDDEISLYRKDAGGIITKIIDGVNGILNTSNNVMKIKVTRDASGKWTLLRDLSGTGNNYFTEGTATDITYTTSSFFGILIKQSTASFFQKHFFDDIMVTTYVPDIIPPKIKSVTTTTQNSIDILFDEAVEINSSQQLSNYSVNNNIGNPVSATRDAINNSLVHLLFSNNFPNGINCTLTINSVQDLSGNVINNSNANFSFYTPQQYDVVIDEIMADPSPPVSLPNYEFIELKNTSAFPINLQGWKISDINSASGPMPSFVLQPDSFVIVCSATALTSLSSFGNAIAVTSFPSLDNDGDILSVSTSAGKIIHALHYDISWYQNDIKSAGGWTLEMIDTKNPCTGFNNWKASEDAKGGTPGKKNSIDGINKDEHAPVLLRTYTIDSTTIVAVFDETVDSIAASQTTNYIIDKNIGEPISAKPTAPLFNEVILKLSEKLNVNTVYQLTSNNITDCSGNIIISNTAKAGLPSLGDTNDIIINEILFNPIPNGYDYVEFYNRSNKVVDMNQLYVSTRDATGALKTITQLSSTPRLFFPDEYYAFSENNIWVEQNYVVKNPDNMLQLSTLPSFSDDNGIAVLLNQNQTVIDELHYDHSWQFALISNEAGVALERIDYDKPTQNQNNWTSAASTAGYGTPTYQNSEFELNALVKGEVTVSPKIFSPDNDGYEDYCFINYQVPNTGYVAGLTIYDASGRSVRNLASNATLALTGSFKWDGLDDKQQRLPVGIYIIVTQIFDLSGKTKQFKNVVTLARRL